MAKKIKFDDRTLFAINDIKYGDKVKFYDCAEAIVYKDAEFRVASEFPEIEYTKYGPQVFVNLSRLGRFLIGKLQRVDEEQRFSDYTTELAARCCFQDEPACASCPYREINQDIFGNPTSCRSVLDKDVVELLHRKDRFNAERRRCNECT